ncbi:MAG TPA: biotin carboxylase N-terminal domain-containing protein [Candidatus Limnocylindrales bacterium]|nr:biotin carboxylase N-terminal domain-containing protein [Candidatus Limnocylindrales bacterium]
MSDELSPSQAARRIGATTRSVQRWISLGQLPARRVGGRWCVASDALDAFAPPAKSATTKPTSESAADPSRLPIRTLFIANRGEIARRIARTTDRLGIRAIAPPTDGLDAVDLLGIGAVVSAARTAGADAVHPGFGFLAENADFAQAVLDAGIRWVGPPPAAIRAMGDKGAARRLATSLGVPVVPGYDDSDQADDALAAAADRIGYPILVKPSAGGGGKGMRTVREPGRLVDALAGARREAISAFGDGRLILERLIEGPRHVEIQVLFDRGGRGIHLGERDCSVQRRHQKVLEETPSPAVTPEIRARLGDAAVRLAAAVGYESAGTCEFLLTDRGETFFLEMNTRLQVEHPVTELVTGLDLVEEQLRIAAGKPLRIDQAESDQRRASGGHAIEVRLYAEDAEAGFLPATGPVAGLRWPVGEEVRVDAGIEAGDVVTGRFDPMLAKVIAHGGDRAAALDRLTAALDGSVVLGLTTNLRFLRWLVREPAVRDGQVRIDTLDRIWPPDDWATRTAIPATAWGAAAQALAADPDRDGWRLNGPARVRLAAEDEERTIELPAPGLGGEPSAGTLDLVRLGETVFVDVGGRSVTFRLAPPPDVDRAARAASTHHGGSAELVAPMPGAVIRVHRAAGDTVDIGDAIVTLEAMKMEHAVVAPGPGIVAEVAVRAGDQVARGQVLAIVEPAR